jgi:hypothetical protein
MKAINEVLDGAARALVYWKSELGRVELFKTMHALDEATKALGYEVAEARERFENSGRRARRVR